MLTQVEKSNKVGEFSHHLHGNTTFSYYELTVIPDQVRLVWYVKVEIL